MDREACIDRLRTALASSPDVSFAVLFGSAANGGLRDDSDLDVAVDFRAELPLRDELDLQARLTTACARSVDLVRLAGASTVLRWEVASKGRLLHGDRRAFAAFQARAASDYIDFAPALDTARGLFRQRLLSGPKEPRP